MVKRRDIPTVHEAFREARAATRFHNWSHPVVRATASRVGHFYLRNAEENKALADFTKQYLIHMDKFDRGLIVCEDNEPVGAAEARKIFAKLKAEFST